MQSVIVMRILDVRLSGLRRRRLYSLRGYDDLFEEHHNIVFATTWLFGCIPICTKIVFKEEIPEWVVNKYATLGYYEWVSSRPYIITAAAERRIIKKIF